MNFCAGKVPAMEPPSPYLPGPYNTILDSSRMYFQGLPSALPYAPGSGTSAYPMDPPRLVQPPSALDLSVKTIRLTPDSTATMEDDYILFEKSRQEHQALMEAKIASRLMPLPGPHTAANQYDYYLQSKPSSSAQFAQSPKLNGGSGLLANGAISYEHSGNSWMEGLASRRVVPHLGLGDYRERAATSPLLPHMPAGYGAYDRLYMDGVGGYGGLGHPLPGVHYHSGLSHGSLYPDIQLSSGLGKQPQGFLEPYPGTFGSSKAYSGGGVEQGRQYQPPAPVHQTCTGPCCKKPAVSQSHQVNGHHSSKSHQQQNSHSNSSAITSSSNHRHSKSNGSSLDSLQRSVSSLTADHSRSHHQQAPGNSRLREPGYHDPQKRTLHTERNGEAPLEKRPKVSVGSLAQPVLSKQLQQPPEGKPVYYYDGQSQRAAQPASPPTGGGIPGSAFQPTIPKVGFQPVETTPLPPNFNESSKLNNRVYAPLARIPSPLDPVKTGQFNGPETQFKPTLAAGQSHFQSYTPDGSKRHHPNTESYHKHLERQAYQTGSGGSRKNQLIAEVITIDDDDGDLYYDPALEGTSLRTRGIPWKVKPKVLTSAVAQEGVSCPPPQEPFVTPCDSDSGQGPPVKDLGFPSEVKPVQPELKPAILAPLDLKPAHLELKSAHPPNGISLLPAENSRTVLKKVEVCSVNTETDDDVFAFREEETVIKPIRVQVTVEVQVDMDSVDDLCELPVLSPQLNSQASANHGSSSRDHSPDITTIGAEKLERVAIDTIVEQYRSSQIGAKKCLKRLLLRLHKSSGLVKCLNLDEKLIGDVRGLISEVKKFKVNGETAKEDGEEKENDVGTSGSSCGYDEGRAALSDSGIENGSESGNSESKQNGDRVDRLQKRNEKHLRKISRIQRLQEKQQQKNTALPDAKSSPESIKDGGIDRIRDVFSTGPGDARDEAEGDNEEEREIDSQELTKTERLLLKMYNRKKKMGFRRKYRSGMDFMRPKKKTSSPSGKSPKWNLKEIKALAAKTLRMSSDNTEENNNKSLGASPDTAKADLAIRKIVTNKALGETILHRAARLGQAELVLRCLKAKLVPVNVRDNAGYTPLHESCSRGHLHIVCLLAMFGADVNSSAAGGIRPLHDAIEQDHVEIVRVLLSYGADPTVFSGHSSFKSEEMKTFFEGFFSDIQGDGCAKRWEYDAVPEDQGEFGCMILGDCLPDSDVLSDRGETGVEAVECSDGVPARLAAAPAHCDEFVFKYSDKPMIPTYVLVDDPDRRDIKYCVMQDLKDHTAMSETQLLDKLGGHPEVIRLTWREFGHSVTSDEMPEMRDPLRRSRLKSEIRGNPMEVVQLVRCDGLLLGLLGIDEVCIGVSI